jgi:hypothetical protein
MGFGRKFLFVERIWNLFSGDSAPAMAEINDSLCRLFQGRRRDDLEHARGAFSRAASAIAPWLSMAELYGEIVTARQRVGRSTPSMG